MAARIVFLLALCYTLLIAVLSLVKLGKISVGDFNPTDKMLHSAAYFVMACLWFFYMLLKRDDNYNYRNGFFKVSLLIIGFGMLIEVLQGALTTYRQPDWSDIVANTIGVFIALAFFIIFLKYLKNVKHQISSFL
ncbi:hypothetical protein BH23BAC2_BH23BAC2_21320 [soil metagenome]